MRLPLLSLAALAVPALCLAQAPSLPRLTLDAVHHDFGRLAPDATASHRFTITNSGTGPLRLGRMEPSCGCTSALVGKDTLAPGESTALDVTFNPRGMKGLVQKSLTLHSDDPARPSLTLTFEANVAGDIIPPGGMVLLQELLPGERRKASVKFESATGQPILLRGVTFSEAPWLGVATRAEGLELWVDLDLAVRRLPAGKMSGTDTLALQVENPAPSILQLSVRWERQSPVSITPGRLAWTEPAGRELSAAVILEHREKKPFRILKVRTSNPILRVASLPKAPGARQGIQVLMGAGTRPGVYNEAVYATLDTPGHPELEIKVAAVLR